MTVHGIGRREGILNREGLNVVSYDLRFYVDSNPHFYVCIEVNIVWMCVEDFHESHHSHCMEHACIKGRRGREGGVILTDFSA